ncbi:fibrillin-2-like [Ruditapes philippinarum]|uniref:fibrillin-2-like n=1 Tax=Ruditapes philippinarum TaxID=129788 RepID=UPI00295AE781|nr:fibrillin-2-like [Ruditapes philippinarum]
MFGEGCKHKCSCNTTNTNKCDNVNGRCICHQGWEGKYCEKDKDECTSNSDICPENSKCENSVGSYSCKCNSGFIMDYKGLCKDINECESNPCTLDVCENIPGSYKCKCDIGFAEIENKCARCTNNKFGVNCSETCRCNGEHSANVIQTCDTATGKCMCQSHWQGDTCSDDVDECEDKAACKDKDNTVCINYDGGYSCKCEHGYKEYPGIVCIKESPIMIDLTVNLNVDVSDKTDPEELKPFAAESLREFYSQYTKADIEILIRNITFASSGKTVRRSTMKELKIDYTVIYKEDDISVASELTVATMDISKGADLKFDGHTVVVKAVNVKGKQPCDVYVETVGICADGFKCEVENKRPVCRTSTSEVNLALIIGVSCGCFILLLLIIIVIMCLRQRKQRKKEDVRMQRELTSASDMGMKLENINSRQGNIYNVLDWQTATNIRDKGDDNESKYMTWKSIASRFTMASGNDSRNDGHYHIPRARMKASPSPNPDYVTPREY